MIFHHDKYSLRGEWAKNNSLALSLASRVRHIQTNQPTNQPTNKQTNKQKTREACGLKLPTAITKWNLL